MNLRPLTKRKPASSCECENARRSFFYRQGMSLIPRYSNLNRHSRTVEGTAPLFARFGVVNLDENLTNGDAFEFIRYLKLASRLLVMFSSLYLPLLLPLLGESPSSTFRFVFSLFKFLFSEPPLVSKNHSQVISIAAFHFFC